MKKSLLLFATTLLLSASAFAILPATSLSKNLGSVWKSHATVHPKQTKNDITIVYGGQDVSLKPILSTGTTA